MAKKCIHGATVGQCGACEDAGSKKGGKVQVGPGTGRHLVTVYNKKPPHNMLRKRVCTCKEGKDHSEWGEK